MGAGVHLKGPMIGKGTEMPDPMNLPEDFTLVCPRCGKSVHPKLHETSWVDKDKVKQIHRGLHCPNCYVNLTKAADSIKI